MTRGRWTRGSAQQATGAANVPKAGSAPEELFASHLKALRLSAGHREFKFHPARKWRFDFAWPDRMLAVEIEGGQWTGGRHTRGAGFAADCEKYNAAVTSGWRVLRFTSQMVTNGAAVKAIEPLLVGADAC